MVIRNRLRRMLRNMGFWAALGMFSAWGAETGTGNNHKEAGRTMGEMEISKDIPGGNIKVLGINGNHATVDVELRDTTEDWFYWSFKVKFPAPGKYEFTFTRDNKISTRGPAVSLNGGMDWQWLGADKVRDGKTFVYEYDGKTPEVYFCMGMQYLQSHLEKFLAEYRSCPYLQVGTLCKSRKGRNVELLTVKEGNPRRVAMLSSRHHAGEMMATRALESLLRTILAEDEFGKAFRKEVAVYVIPFIDKDGVEDGDQGKRRAPHDHNGDYIDFLYPETKAIAALLEQIRPEFILDMHCPWIKHDINECPYFVGPKEERAARELARFSAMLEAETPPQAPYYAADNLPFGTAWNNGSAAAKGWKAMRTYARAFPFVRCDLGLETPFANFREHTIGQQEIAAYGAAIARAIARWFRETPPQE